MSDKSKIEWTEATWNPIRGCRKISPGCKHCYAETFAERFRGVPNHPYEQGFDLRLVPEKLAEPLIFPGDVNANIYRILDAKKISIKEATFCLLDQHTNQCDWATVQALAEYKTENKIELFYFLANKWLPRSLAALKNPEPARKWWGNDDWERLQKMRAVDRAKLLADRFQKELGYKHAVPWPIYDRKDGRTIMFFMVHATDHPAAVGLMDRAYHKAVISEKDFEQVRMAWSP